MTAINLQVRDAACERNAQCSGTVHLPHAVRIWTRIHEAAALENLQIAG